MFHPFDILTLDNGARLIFTPCPGTRGVPLANSLKSLKEAGAQAVITMMTLAELSENEADALPSLCADFYMDWFHLPVEDSCAPEAPFEQAFARKKRICWRSSGLAERWLSIVMEVLAGQG